MGPRTRVELLLQYEEQLQTMAMQNRMTLEEFIELCLQSEERSSDLDDGLRIIERIKALQLEH